MFTFNYPINASTHIETLDQTITVPPGRFTGGIDLATRRLKGDITLPPATFTCKPAGVRLVTAIAQIVEVKKVKGTVDLTNLTLTATSVFNIHIVNGCAATPPLPVQRPPVNLVDDNCVTATPVTVTTSGTAHLNKASTFSDVFTIPDFVTCGLATAGLNLLIPGPGNTFTATSSPATHRSNL